MNEAEVFVLAQRAEGAIRRHDLVVSTDDGALRAVAAAVNRHIEVGGP